MSSFARAVIVILLAILLFDVQGAFVKLRSERYSIPLIATWRNLFGLIPSILILALSKEWRQGNRKIRLPQWRLAILRGLAISAAQFFFYLSLSRMELATASTLAFAGPLFITALSVPILRSQVGWIRWTAVVIGFVGIVMVMRPGSGLFSTTALLPVVAAFGYGLSSVLVKLFDSRAHTALINLYTTVVTLICSSILVVVLDGYSPIQSAQDWSMMVSTGLVGGVAVFCLIVAYRLTEPGNLSPFEYFGIPFSFAIGYLIFDEAPIGTLMPGVLFIVGGGLLIVWRERRQSAPTEHTVRGV